MVHSLSQEWGVLEFNSLYICHSIQTAVHKIVSSTSKWVFPILLKHFWSYSYVFTYKCISIAILDPIKLAVETNYQASVLSVHLRVMNLLMTPTVPHATIWANQNIYNVCWLLNICSQTVFKMNLMIVLKSSQTNQCGFFLAKKRLRKELSVCLGLIIYYQTVHSILPCGWYQMRGKTKFLWECKFIPSNMKYNSKYMLKKMRFAEWSSSIA